MQCQNRLLNQLILHPLLFQAHAVAEAVVAKVVVECLFAWVEGWQVAQHASTTEFFGPQVPVHHEGVAIHKERAGVRKVLAEAAQDGEAMRVEVAPIVQGLVCDPWEGSEQVDGVAASEDGEHLSTLRSLEAMIWESANRCVDGFGGQKAVEPFGEDCAIIVDKLAVDTRDRDRMAASMLEFLDQLIIRHQQRTSG